MARLLVLSLDSLLKRWIMEFIMVDVEMTDDTRHLADSEEPTVGKPYLPTSC